MVIEIPDEAMKAMKISPEKVGARLRMAAGAKFYEMGDLSSGAAADLAGIPRTVFLQRLSEFGVDTFRLREEELKSETRFA